MTLCTLFDSGYLQKGLALLASLRRHVQEFHLYVLALDAGVLNYFRRNVSPQVTVLDLAALEGDALAAARCTRTWQEYVWTLTPALPLYCLERYDAEHIAYLDADCFLFSDLQPLYDEVGAADVAIIPHRWAPPHRARSEANGLYNVSWVYFRNSQRGLACLMEWQAQCLAWCYYRKEAGKFADQGYLNDWPRQHGAHVVQQLGADLAPWNQEQYQYTRAGGHLCISDGKRQDRLLFYHFHELQWGRRKVLRRTNYPLHPAVAQYIYQPYEMELAAWT